MLATVLKGREPVNDPVAVLICGENNVATAPLQELVEGVEEGLRALTLESHVVIGILDRDIAHFEVLKGRIDHLRVKGIDECDKAGSGGCLVQIGSVDAVSQEAQLALTGDGALAVEGVGTVERPTSEAELTVPVDGHDSLEPEEGIIGRMSGREYDLCGAAHVEAVGDCQADEVVFLQAAIVYQTIISIYLDHLKTASL